MASNSTQQVDAQDEGTAETPPVLLCAHCGGGFSVWSWQPRLRCPHCRILGYPDRAMRNLLSLDWNCPDCGSVNGMATNFCVACGAGLASRCLRCERPVYTVVCHHCGAHQASVFRYQEAQTRQIAWEPIARGHIQEQQHKEEAAKDLPISSPAQTESAQDQPEPHRWPGLRLFGGLMMIAVGFYFLEQQGIISFSQLFQSFFADANMPAWMVDVGNLVQAWWAMLTPTFEQLATLSNEDPRYFYLFATVVFGLACLPLLLRLIDRVARWIFP